ncbi:MAG: protein kinase, partial [Planctomycetales bacterium]|nr:protein kinase [Planctomycetales bacterium]
MSDDRMKTPGDLPDEPGGEQASPPSINIKGDHASRDANSVGSMGWLYVSASHVYKTPKDIARFDDVFAVEEANLKKLQKYASPLFPKFEGVVQDHAEKKYLKLERVAGTSLARQLRELVPEQFLYVLQQLSMALRMLHGEGVMHRDLHQGNVLFDPDSLRVTIIDFGISSSTDEDDKVAGKTHLPQFRGQGRLRPDIGNDLDHRDTYAVGKLIECYFPQEFPIEGDAEAGPIAAASKDVGTDSTSAEPSASFVAV